MVSHDVKSYSRSVYHTNCFRNESPLRIYYDVEENVPYFRRGFAESRASTIMEVSRNALLWFDPRPANDHDRELLINAVSKRFGRDLAQKLEPLFNQGLVFVSSDSHASMDHALEFFVNGYPLAIVFMDLVRDEIDVVPRDILASLLVMEGVGRESGVKIVVRNGIIEEVQLYSENRWVSLRSLIRVDVPTDLYLQVLSAKKRDWYDVYRANHQLIESMVDKTRRAVEWLEKTLGKKGFLAFSGGKDSVLAAALLTEVGSNFSAVYTHIEKGDPPNVYDYANRLATKLGFEMHVIEHRWSRVSEMLRSFGMPFRGYRWCTNVFKFYPQLALAKKLYGLDKVVSYTGSRKYETLRRSIKPATYVDAELGVVSHSVPYKFPRLVEYLVLRYRYGIELFPDYPRGFERLSCIACPYKTAAELKLAQRFYEEEFSFWTPFIYRLCEEISPTNPRVVLKKHLWRFGYQVKELRETCLDVGVECRIPTPTYARTSVERQVRRDFPRLLNNLRALFPEALTENRGNLVVVRIDVCTAEISSESLMFHFANSLERCLDLMLLLEASTNCASCGVCSIRCPREAISLPLRIDGEKCVRCYACIRGCMVAWSRVLKRVSRIRSRKDAFKLYARFKKVRSREYVARAAELEKKLYESKRFAEEMKIDVAEFLKLIEGDEQR